MKRLKRNKINFAFNLFFIFFALCLPLSLQSEAATMQDYCVVPPFLAQAVPPLVMFEAGRDHKLYYEAYNDASDLDEDGRLDTTYKHTIDYYGYFDPNKCYTYSSTGTGEFNPVSVTGTKFCSAGQWSGNVLNWLNMSRMDSLKKVLYGGHRVTDSNAKTVLERDIMPGDAHSWGKELTGRLCSDGTTYTYACKRDSDCESGEACVDKSANLIGIAAATEPFDCSATGAVTWTTQNSPNGRVRVARYYHDAALSDDVVCGTDSVGSDPVVARANFLSSFQPEDTANFIDQFLATNFNDATRLDPTNDHYDNYNIVAVAEFNVANSERNNTWQFLIDGDDPVEVEIGVVASGFSGGSIVASYYGCHSECFTAAIPPNSPVLCNANQLGNYKPGSQGYHRIIVRHSERSGQDGVRLWYRKRSTDAWQIFPSGLTTKTPNVAAGAECTLKSNQFVALGEPQRGTSGAQHLFCGTNLAANQPPILRMITNNTHRKWEWASKENPVCLGTFNDGTSGTITDYTVRAEVCKSSVGLESNCKQYGSNYKPIGLLQKYGEGDGSKVCSKGFSKACNSDADCDIPTEGMCIDKSQMYFGFMTTSYTKNTSGGVLRKNFGSITDETNINNGIFQTSENVQGNIIITFDRLSPTVGYDFGAHNYTAASGGTCGWITNAPISEGQCRMWGNPIGEMMYESLRYIAGKGSNGGSPTAAFDYSGPSDSGLSLSHPAWGYNKGSTWYKPYELYPECARPFMLVLSDVNTSFDDDQLPGANGSSFTEDAASPQLNMDVSDLADTIGTTEGIAGNNWFIGESGSTKDFMCSSKAVTNLSQIKGICPFEPTKKGSYYAAAVSYYAKTQLKTNTGKPNADTFVVALDSPLANLKVKAGSNFVNILPLGKSISGGLRTNCADRCTPASTTADANGLHLGTCSSNAFCPTNQVVDIYVDSIKYDNSNNVVYALYRINFEDVEQGADHDMDAIVQYEICTAEAFTNEYGSCGADPTEPNLGSNQIQVKVNNVYGVGGIDQVLGFVISGTTADGPYLVVKDGDVSVADGDTPAVVAGLPLSFSKIFTTTASATEVLNNPLWYAAKWGGFDDIDGDGKAYSDPSCGTATPDAKCKEWDKDGDGTPDNYFLVANPLKLEEQLNKALLAILTKVSSGTAASVLASGQDKGANILQSVFYPRRQFDNGTVDWTGTLQNLWYYIDPLFKASSIREDTDQNNILHLKNDYVARYYFDEAGSQTTRLKLYWDENGNYTPPPVLVDDIPVESLKNLWEAGKILWQRDISADPRIIKTYIGEKSGVAPVLRDFSAASKTALRPYLQAADDTESEAIIRYINGEDSPAYRNRTAGMDLDADGDVTGPGEEPKVWKLGDIVNSTPQIVSWVPLNTYDLKYKDTTYEKYICKDMTTLECAAGSGYKNRGIVFTGANDGMLHAFKLGLLELDTDPDWSPAAFERARIVNPNTGVPSVDSKSFGSEIWAFIPKHVLPYLKYNADTGYCHLYNVDGISYVADASIGGAADVERRADGSSWRTVIIGSMKQGGACREAGSTCTNCVKAPGVDLSSPADGDSVDTVGGNDESRLGMSSYFAIDITDKDPDNWKLLWEFSDENIPDSELYDGGIYDGGLGFSTASPAVVRINPATCTNAGGVPQIGEKKKICNGEWFVAIPSGPTGPIDKIGKQFMGRSDQKLKVFVINLKDGAYRTAIKDFGGAINYAFGGSALEAALDADKDYPDDVLYIGYTKSADGVDDTFTQGGVVRIITNEDPNPVNWAGSKLIEGIGPVNAAVGKMKNTAKHELWTYFGTGRYFFKQFGGIDDSAGARAIYGVKDPCYIYEDGGAKDPDETFTIPCSLTVSAGDLDDATNAPNLDSDDIDKGWFINLEGQNVPESGFEAERLIGDPTTSTLGVTFFTTFKPSADVCSYGGRSHIWAVKADTGGTATSLLRGKALIQVSTGAIEEIDLKKAFEDRLPDPLDPNDLGNPDSKDDRRTGAIIGRGPDGSGLILLTPPPPSEKVLHMREK